MLVPLNDNLFATGGRQLVAAAGGRQLVADLFGTEAPPDTNEGPPVPPTIFCRT